ncbi:glycosyltransferase [Picrophilus oshimae]|uniref:Glycosyltransferase n=1 Tax=Picrophilus torridus (strain ATCC 700027 / DSM 9790 / JCM 10055 / NBRC 100828 / KAW 2/3) TaxID=1122961 RepID=Q6L2E3_PICTO|nr:glycosyltransferase [Picrophilus oshimae]AAT42859.1 glycosyltransferase [Picrophilus oshimae DSM 9789]
MILQLCHGKVIPEYSSAYSKRCYSLFKDSRIMSIGGLSYLDKSNDRAAQYHDYLLMAMSYLRGNRSFEILLSQGRYLRKKYFNDALNEIEKNKIIVFEGPWQYRLFKDYLNNKVIIYDAHNVEYLLRQNNIYQNYVKGIEHEILKKSDIVISLSRRDIDNFVNIYSVDKEKIYYVPLTLSGEFKYNGINSNYIVFIGSMYEPNIRALEFINDIAGDINMDFYIIGSVSSHKLKNKRRNLRLLGMLPEEEKDKILCNALFAINPVPSGSGRNLKILDYLSHGLPVITTETGLNGYEQYNIKEAVIVSDLKDFKENIIKLMNDKNLIKSMSSLSHKVFINIMNAEGSLTGDDIIKDVLKFY